MPKAKIKNYKRSDTRRLKTAAVTAENLPADKSPLPQARKAITAFTNKFYLSRFIILGLFVAILAFFFWQNRGLLVAATVNGQPVWRLNLEQRLNQRYARQTLEEIINEDIVLQAAAKKHLTASDKEINDKIASVEKSLAGKTTLKDALAQEGLTMDEFRQQVKLQILVEKLTADQVRVTDKEIDDYIAQNKASLTATEAGAMREEAKNALESQKRNTAFRDLFDQLTKSAKISKFL